MKCYLDNSATTRPTESVVEAMALCMRDGYFNPSSLYAPAVEAEKRVRRVRERLLQLICGEKGRLVFTSGGTEANNLAILGAAERMRGARHVVVMKTEHPSVIEAYDLLEKKGHRVTRIGADASGQMDWAALQEALLQKPSLISCMHVNNETGAVADIGRLSRMARSRAPEALLHVDGVQGFLRLPFDARGVDLYTLSAHKIHGPKGVGALYVGPGVRLAPAHIGGGQEGGLRSGTENTPGIAGLGQAAEDMARMEGLAEALYEKKRLLYARILDAVPEALINGPDVESGAPHILNLSFPRVRGEVLLHALEGSGVYCSTGSACSSKKRVASPALLAMGLSADRAGSALRFSLSFETGEAEILRAAEVIGEQYPLLKRYQRR